MPPPKRYKDDDGQVIVRQIHDSLLSMPDAVGLDVQDGDAESVKHLNHLLIVRMITRGVDLDYQESTEATQSLALGKSADELRKIMCDWIVMDLKTRFVGTL